MTTLDYGMFDVDNHFYEPRDSFSRHIESRYADRAVHHVIDADGRKQLIVSGRPVRFVDHPKRPPGQEDWVGKPGSRREFLRKMKSSDPVDTGSFLEPIREEFLDRDKRLVTMDDQGIEGCLMFPASAVVVERFFADPEELYANFRSWNRWLEEEWGYAYRERIFAPPMVSLRDVNLAVAEVRRLIERGARVIALGMGPAYGRSPADPYFDPVWAPINEAGLSVAYHLTESGLTRPISELWGEDPDPPNFQMSAWQWLNVYGDLPVIATISSLVYGNLFARFPNIRVAIVECGASWLPYLMSVIDKMRGMGRNGPWLGGQLPERPTAIMRRHFVVTPYFEDDVASIVDAVGPEMIALGSDYPHPESHPEPLEFQQLINHLPNDQQRMILRDNGMRLVQS
jgi:predicted TIM-barrel fold metal-dependent hydrolase